MTSTRRLPTPTERESRTGQYDPGHVGGRVASAQPIRRRGGTLRERAVGTAGAVTEPEVGNPLSGVVPVVSATTGTINRFGGPQSHPLAGTVAGSTTTAGTIVGTLATDVYTDTYAEEY